MNTGTKDFSYDTSAGSTSGAAMLLIWQILPQLQLLKNCRGGWKAIADIAKDEVETLRIRIEREQFKFKQIEQEYFLRMASLRMKVQRAYDEKHDMKNLLLNTTMQLQKLQHQSKIIALNFTKEKENILEMLNESSKYILTNKEFLKNISIELSSIIVNNGTNSLNSSLENKNNSEHEIRKSLVTLTKLIQKMRKELITKDSKVNEVTEVNEELMEDYKSCQSSKEELQDELNEAKELGDRLNEIMQEKQQLQRTNENLLKHILSLLESTATYNNLTLEAILKQTSAAARDINRYIVEPTAFELPSLYLVHDLKLCLMHHRKKMDEAKKLILNSILKNRTKEEALISAAKKGNLTEISILLDNGANIEAGDSSEWKLKPLHWAAHQGHWNATRLLLLRGANVNGQSNLKVTALHMAVNRNHRNVMDLLLKGGAEIEARDELGYTPLFQAVVRDCATAKLLVDRGANVSTTNDKGITAVSMASDCVRDLLCSKGAIDPQCKTEDERPTTALPSRESS